MDRLRRVAACVLAAALPLAAIDCEALVVLDQANTVSPGFGVTRTPVTSSNQAAQTFTIGVAGALDTIDLSFSVDDGAVGDVIFSLLPTSFGTPNSDIGAALFQTAVPLDAIADFSVAEPFTASVDVSDAGLVVQPGEVYAVALTRDPSAVSNVSVGSSGVFYSRGERYRRSSSFFEWTSISGDLLFRTFVDTDVTSGSRTIAPNITATVQFESGSFVLDTAPPTLVAAQRLALGIDDRAFLEFPLAAIPDNARLTRATLELDPFFFESTSADEFPEIPIFGFAGDGFASLDDASVTADLVGIAGPITSNDPISVDLDLAFVGEMIAARSQLGLAMLGSGLQAGFNVSSATPALVVDFDFIVPGDFNGDDAADLLDLDILGQNFGITSGATIAQGDANEDGAVDLLDLDILGVNFDTDASAVPEAGAVSPIAAAWCATLLRRRES